MDSRQAAEDIGRFLEQTDILTNLEASVANLLLPVQRISASDCDTALRESWQGLGNQVATMIKGSHSAQQALCRMSGQGTVEIAHPLTQAFFEGAFQPLLQEFGLLEEWIDAWGSQRKKLRSGRSDRSADLDPTTEKVLATAETLSALFSAERQMPGLTEYYVNFFAGMDYAPTQQKLHQLNSWRRQVSADQTADTEAGDRHSYTYWKNYQETLLKSAGLSPETINHLWKTYANCSRNSDPFELMTLNARMMMDFSDKHGSKALNHLVAENGIECFSRYPRHLLSDQLREPDATQEYLLFICSKTDYNEALHYPGSMLDHLKAATGLPVRIIETGSPLELARRLRKTARQMKGGQASLVIVGAHANEDRIKFGEIQSSNRPWETGEVTRFSSWFQDDLHDQATIILGACSTGQRIHTAIAQGLSGKQVTVHAPAGPNKLTYVYLQNYSDPTANQYSPQYLHSDSVQTVNSSELCSPTPCGDNQD